MRFTRIRRHLSRLALVGLAGAAASSLVAAPPSSAATKAKAKPPAKKAATAKKPATATAKKPATATARTPAFDPNRCTYVGTDAIAATVGVPVALDTSPGDAGTNTHLVSSTFEQCVFNRQDAAPGDAGRMRVIVHVQRNGTTPHTELRDGLWESPCPTACATVPGLGSSAVLTPTYGAGGGFTSGAWVFLDVLKGTTRVFVAVAPSDPSVNNGNEYANANAMDPAQVEQAKKLAAIVLAQV